MLSFVAPLPDSPTPSDCYYSCQTAANRNNALPFKFTEEGGIFALLRRAIDALDAPTINMSPEMRRVRDDVTKLTADNGKLICNTVTAEIRQDLTHKVIVQEMRGHPGPVQQEKFF
jgi:hypothetical protein